MANRTQTPPEDLTIRQIVEVMRDMIQVGARHRTIVPAGARGTVRDIRGNRVQVMGTTPRFFCGYFPVSVLRPVPEEE